MFVFNRCDVVVDNILFSEVFDVVMVTKTVVDHRHVRLNISGDMGDFIGEDGDSLANRRFENALLSEFLIVDVLSDRAAPGANKSCSGERADTFCSRDGPRASNSCPGDSP